MRKTEIGRTFCIGSVIPKSSTMNGIAFEGRAEPIVEFRQDSTPMNTM